MNTGEFRYKISIAVNFTPEEVDFLIKCAQSHYDATCRAAGMSFEDGARENGFIKQLKLFPEVRQFWDFGRFDLTAKILERHMGTRLGFGLAKGVAAALSEIAKRGRELA